MKRQRGDKFIPIRNTDAHKGAAESTIEAGDTFRFDDMNYGFIQGLRDG
jgi:hypothetical protein